MLFRSKMARAALGWSTHQLAEAAGINRITVVRFEKGEGVADESASAIEKALTGNGAQFSRRSGRVGVSVPE